MSASVLGVVCVGWFAFAILGGAIIGGLITASINRRRPTERARRWGLAFGAINLVAAALAGSIAAPLVGTSVDLDVLALYGGGAIGALCVAVLATVAALARR